MRRLIIVFAFVVVASLPAPVVAGSPQDRPAGEAGQAQSRSTRPPTIGDRTQNMKKLDGYFPLYWDEAAGTLFMEISRFNQDVLYLNGLAAGLGSNDIGLDRAQLGGTRVVKFQRIGPKILMVEPNLDYRATSPNPAERKAVEDAFAQSVIWGFTVAAENDGRVLVDLTDFLMRDAHGVAGRLTPAQYRFDRSRSAVYMANTRAFPKNTEIEVTTTLTTEGAGGRGGGPGQLGGRIADVTPSPEAITVRQHHSFVELPDGNYRPRLMDPRAGYFGVSFVDFSTPFGADVRTRFLNRHRIEKRDPNAAMSDPVKPIIYYVDPGAPEPIRSTRLSRRPDSGTAFASSCFPRAPIRWTYATTRSRGCTGPRAAGATGRRSRIRVPARSSRATFRSDRFARSRTISSAKACSRRTRRARRSRRF
jgi:Domain of unknown function (DUF5117)